MLFLLFVHCGVEATGTVAGAPAVDLLHGERLSGKALQKRRNTSLVIGAEGGAEFRQPGAVQILRDGDDEAPLRYNG